MRWLRHVVRRDDKYVGKRMRRMQMRKRKGGRPKRSWEDCVKRIRERERRDLRLKVTSYDIEYER